MTPIFSPDTSLTAILDLLKNAQKTIYIEQLYIYRYWGNTSSPLVEALVNKAEQGLDIRIILNYNPWYQQTNEKNNDTLHYLSSHNISVKYHYTNWSIFTNLHNKGVIVDNTTVLISSINWNEPSLMKNREAGIIIENKDIASYYASAFYTDWQLNPYQQNVAYESSASPNAIEENSNSIYIITLFIMTFAVIARDWRKRPWT